MNLSIVTATNRVGLSTYARILDVCALASDDVEVIVRDNSQSAQKKKFLSDIDSNNCKIFFVEHCGAEENMLEALRETTGKYVFFVADDDLCSKRSIEQVVRCISNHADDPSLIGVTGQYALEDNSGLRVFEYPPLDTHSVVERNERFLTSAGSNLLFYSAIRRDVMLDAFQFVKSLPFMFSFTDRIYTLIYLLSGRFENIKRVIYNYDMSEWETVEKGTSKDLSYYIAAGFDSSIIRLHWLLCALEGVKVILSPAIGRGVDMNERQSIARIWFAVMHNKFKNSASRSYSLSDSHFDRESVALRDKWMNISDVSIETLLMDICGFMALSSRDASFKYYTYWSSL